jgi:nitrogen fixation NifU-like protein
MDDAPPELLISHFEDPYHRGDCERATHAHQAHDPATEHSVAISLKVNEERHIEEAWFESAGCLFCEAPASILVQYAEGKSLDKLGAADCAFFLKLTHLDSLAHATSCQQLAWRALQGALRSADAEAELLDEGRPMFGGPSLGEES